MKTLRLLFVMGATSSNQCTDLELHGMTPIGTGRSMRVALILLELRRSGASVRVRRL